MRRRDLPFGLIGLSVFPRVRAVAQPAGQVPLVAYLSEAIDSDLVARASIDALRQGLREIGLLEDRDIRLELLFSYSHAEELPGMARELVDRDVKVIITASGEATRAARLATGSVPIVMASSSDPVGEGLVKSLARPTGNVTGISVFSDKLWGKKISLLREVVPGLERLAILADVLPPRPTQRLERAAEMARSMGLEPLAPSIHQGTRLEDTLTKAVQDGAQGLLVLEEPGFIDRYLQVIAFVARRLKLPGIGPHRAHAEAGLLMSYGADIVALNHRVAWYVHRLLQGAKPADLPVEQPTQFELVINLKTAEELGVAISPSILLRAHEVIQ